MSPENTATPQKPFYKRAWVQALAVLLVLAAGIGLSQVLIATAPKAERRAPERTARLVTAEPVQADSRAVSLLGYGIVQAQQQLNLQAQVAGTVRELGPKFVPGARFKKGEVLVRLDDTDYRIELQTAQAALAQARSNLTTEEGNQVVAQADFELLGLDTDERERALILRKPQLEAAKAAVQSAQASVDRAKVNLERTVLRAPFDGVVVSRQASVGAQVNASSMLGELASGQAFWVSVAVPQADLRWINFPSQGQAGSPVCVSDASSDEKACHKGRVLSLQSSVQEGGRQAQVLVEVSSQANGDTPPLLLSQYVRVRFEGKTLPDVFELRPAHVHGSTVWVLKDGALDIRPVNVVFRSAEYVLIDQGLQAGDVVVTSNIGSPVQGMALRTQTQQSTQ